MAFNIYEFCEMFALLHMWPVFDVFHFILASLNMKKEVAATNPTASASGLSQFEKKHPLASWFSTMILCYAGAIFACLLFGKPLATLFMNPEKIAVSTLVWYVINYVPGVYSLLTNRWIMCVIVSMKEVHRIFGIHAGVVEASSSYSSFYIILFVFGFLKGTAAELLMVCAKLCSGISKPNSQPVTAFLFPSCMFKASAIISIIFCLEHYSYIQVTHSVLYTCVVLVTIYLRILMVLGFVGDPFIPFENLFCAVAFGGMWEAYRRVVRQDKKGRPSANGDVHHQPHKLKKS